MNLEIVSAVSIVLQVLAAIFALRLVRVSGNRTAWALISAGILLMGVRRGFTLFRLLSGEAPHSHDLWYEVIGLVTSVFMLGGVVSIGPIFAAIRKTEQGLRRSEQRLRNITSSLGEGLYLMDVNGQVTFMNPEAERLLGWTEAEVKNKSLHDVVHNRRTDGTYLPIDECGIRNVIMTGVIRHSNEEIFTRKDGTSFPIAVISAPMVEDGKIVGAVSAFRDISETKKIEQEREKLFRELETALATIKTLRGILPVCASCKKIRDEKGSWKPMESYIAERTDAQFSHSVCPECMKELYPGYERKS